MSADNLMQSDAVDRAEDMRGLSACNRGEPKGHVGECLDQSVHGEPLNQCAVKRASIVGRWCEWEHLIQTGAHEMLDGNKRMRNDLTDTVKLIEFCFGRRRERRLEGQ